jgi:hypothetical protein
MFMSGDLSASNCVDYVTFAEQFFTPCAEMGVFLPAPGAVAMVDLNILGKAALRCNAKHLRR